MVSISASQSWGVSFKTLAQSVAILTDVIISHHRYRIWRKDLYSTWSYGLPFWELVPDYWLKFRCSTDFLSLTSLRKWKVLCEEQLFHKGPKVCYFEIWYQIIPQALRMAGLQSVMECKHVTNSKLYSPVPYHVSLKTCSWNMFIVAYSLLFSKIFVIIITQFHLNF